MDADREGELASAGPPPLDPEMRAVLDALDALGAQPVHSLSPTDARRQPTVADAMATLLKVRGDRPEGNGLAQSEYRFAQGADGEVAIRVYTPQPAGRAPVILYIHDGGWVLGNLAECDESARALAHATATIVVSTHYRLAPEHRFPAAHEDVFAVYRWLLAHAQHLFGDPERIAVAGEGAGGNMAFNICARARDEGMPTPRHQCLIYPLAGAGVMTESYVRHEHARPLDKATIEWYFRHLLGSQTLGLQEHRRDPRIDLVARSDLAGLPPATVITAEIDPLRSDGERLAQRLADAGVDVRDRCFEGLPHGFFGLGPVVSRAADAVGFAADGIRRSLAAVPDPAARLTTRFH